MILIIAQNDYMQAHKWNDYVPGYEEQVVPGVVASYNIPGNGNTMKTGIRICMSYREFKGIAMLIKSSPSYMKARFLAEKMNFRYNLRGFGEFYFENYRNEYNNEIINQLIKAGEKIEVLLLEAMIRK